MIKLTEKWVTELIGKPETGMGYQIVSVVLMDGRLFEQVIIIDGLINGIRGLDNIPFTVEEIAQIILTHDKWDFNAERKDSGRLR